MKLLTLVTNSRSATAAASFLLLALLISSFELTSASTDQTDLKAQAADQKSTCRTGTLKAPHQFTLWNTGFPNDEESVEALCEGSVEVKDDGEICITGRVSYAQLAKAVGKPIRAPAAGTISVTGHLISGIPNVVLGYEANYLYDYVTSYMIGDKVHMDPGDITNDLLAATNGIIKEVCLDASFAKDEEVYSISHDAWFPPSKAVEEKYTDANVIFASTISIVAEYHKPSDIGPIFGTITSALSALFSNLLPGFVFDYFPFLLGLTGLGRLTAFGTVSTAKFPQPLVAPGIAADDIQIDTKWTTLMDAMADGLFTKNVVPPYFGIVIKKISASPASNGCWKEDTAAIDIMAPPGYGDKLDEYIDQELLPALVQAGGEISLHMGKRLRSDSDYLNAALDFYSNVCDVDLDVNPDNCYHPACERRSRVTSFEYPSDLYQAGKK